MKCVHCGLPSGKHNRVGLACLVGRTHNGILMFSGTSRFTPPEPAPDTRLVARAAHLYTLALVANSLVLENRLDDEVSMRIQRRAVDRARLDILRQGLQPEKLRTAMDCFEAMRGRIWRR